MDRDQNYNHIRIYHKLRHPEEQEIYEIQDSYVFKTHPSLGCSQDKSKNIPKSQIFIEKTHNHDDYYKKQSKTKRNLLKYQLQQKLMSTQKQFQKDHEVKAQRQQILQQKISKLTKNNRLVQSQNAKLRSYVQFLQDYNLRLKKQLMRSIRRRNLDSSLGNLYDYQPQKQQQHQVQQFPFGRHQFSSVQQNKNFSTIWPLQNLASKPIFTNQQLANQGPYRNVSFGNDPNHQFQPPKYVRAFYQTNQKPLPYSYYTHQKIPTKYEHIYKNNPSSLQSSVLNVSNQINPQISSKYVSSQKLCACLNTSLPVFQSIATPVSQHHDYYRSLEHTANKAQENKTKKKTVCAKCQKSLSINQKSSKLSKRSAKNKQKTSKNTEKFNFSTGRRCVSCNERKSSKRTNASKSTIPTKQKPFSNIFQSNQLSEKLKTMHQKGAKMQKMKQKIKISEFRLS